MALQNYIGEWRELRGSVTIYRFEPSKEFKVGGTSGFGFRMWDARRLKKAQRATEVLADAAERCAPDIQTALHDVSEFVAEYLPLSVTDLPRGYRLVLNMENQRSLELDGTLFDPTAAEPQPSTEAIGRLQHDIATGWFAELVKSWPEFPTIEGRQR